MTLGRRGGNTPLALNASANEPPLVTDMAAWFTAPDRTRFPMTSPTTSRELIRGTPLARRVPRVWDSLTVATLRVSFPAKGSRSLRASTPGPNLSLPDRRRHPMKDAITPSSRTIQYFDTIPLRNRRILVGTGRARPKSEKIPTTWGTT